jgi:stage IV sporulation protein FB
LKEIVWWRRWYIHPLFVVVLLVYALTGHLERMIIAFLVVLMHELAHALVAESYGMRVERIEIWPFGGVARIDGLGSQDPDVEMMVAMAGPIQNFLLAAVAWAIIGRAPMPNALVHEFISVNLGLGALNLLPVAPLDGGRLAAVFLSRRIGHHQAERVVRESGLWLARGTMALALILAAFGHISLELAVFAVFLYWGAKGRGPHSGYWMVRDLAIRPLRFKRRPIWALDDLAVRDTTLLGQVIEVMRPMRYHRIAVLDENLERIGILYEEELIRALQQRGPSVTVGQILVAR